MFHRFRIGSMDAMIVSDGPLALPRAARIFSGPDEAAMDAALGGAGSRDRQGASGAKLPAAANGRHAGVVRQRHGLVETVRAGQRQVAGQPGAGGHRSGGDRCAGADARAFGPLLGHDARRRPTELPQRDDLHGGRRTGVLGIQPARRAPRTQPGRCAQAPAAAARPHRTDPRRARVPAGGAGLGDAGPHARPHGVSARRAAGA